MNINNILNGVQSAQGIINSIAGLFDGGAGNWKDSLQQASYKGISFGVFQADIQFGRRNALHEYPFKETVWVEDMGKATRKISFSAFFLEDDLVYGGGSVIGQLENFLTACESKDEGELVHPLLGTMTASLMEANAVAKSDSGRVIELSLVFVESGQRNFPASVTDAANDIKGLLEGAMESVLGDFGKRAFTAMQSGINTTKQVMDQAAKWAALGQKLINNAARIYNTVRNIPGVFGRYGLAGVSRSIKSISSSTKNVLAARTQAIKQYDESKKLLNEKASKMGAT